MHHVAQLRRSQRRAAPGAVPPHDGSMAAGGSGTRGIAATPCWDAQHGAGDARRRCPIKIHGKQTLQMHLYPPSQHDFCASQQARLDAQSQDDPSGSTSRSTTGHRRAAFQDPSGRAERSPSHAQESSTRKTWRASRGAARRNARESGGRRGLSHRRARASSTAGAALAASHRSGRVGQHQGLELPGSTARHRRVATQSRDAQHSARDKWLPRQTLPT